MFAGEFSRRLAADGFAVLEHALDPDLVRAAEACCRAVLARKNRARTRLPIELYRRSPFRELLRAVDRSAPALSTTRTLPTWTASECWIRSSPPGGRAQRVHRDRHVLAAHGAAADPVPGFSLDILLTDFTEENGATEVWPGSHRNVDRDALAASRAAERAALRPSTRIVASAGSIVARDLRAWHRAMPNRTATPRQMLSAMEAAPEPRSQPT